jgi:putative hemolysin
MNGTMPMLQSADSHGQSAGVLAHAPALAGLPRFAGKLLPLEQAHELYERVRKSADGFLLEGLLREMNVDLRVSDADVARIPRKGPAVVVANHPYGMLDGAVLAVVLARVRPDVRIMTNFLLEGLPELERHCIFVDPLQTAGSTQRNRRALKQAVEWLKQGGMLAIFPAGEVSHWQMPQGAIADPQWSDTATRLIRKTGAAALPVYFCGRNSLGFQLMGMIHPRVRMAFLLQEFLQQSGKSVALRVGSPIPTDSMANIAGDREATQYLRWRTYLLAERGKARGRLPGALRSVFPQKGEDAITPALPRELLVYDVQGLPAERRLAENGELAAYAAQSAEIPHLLREVGRLREVTFRAAGEGTGKRSDLDAFDRYYWHLLLWNKAKSELVGAYRAGNTAEIVAEHGVSGLYTSTLFRYDQRLFEKMGPALELGRSFVRPEYQRQYAPLLLLWKAIARFVTMRPETPVLFGVVSISNAYNHASRELIYSFFETRKQGDAFAGLVTPRQPFRPGRLRNWHCRAVCSVLRDLDELSEPIADVEIDGKGLPILLKQYAKVGGKLLGFNVDRQFSDVLDGLVMVDLRETEPALLERYMGREGGAAFQRCHGRS